MNHSISEDIYNSDLERCIDEFVRLERDRAILRDHWFGGVSMMRLSEKYDLSLTAIKAIVYGKGDNILLRAEQLSKSRG